MYISKTSLKIHFRDMNSYAVVYPNFSIVNFAETFIELFTILQCVQGDCRHYVIVKVNILLGALYILYAKSQ